MATTIEDTGERARSNDERPPMAEPGTRPQGADVGGMRSTADGGLADHLQRSTEHGDDDSTGAAITGSGSAGGQASQLDRGGKNAPGAAPGQRADASGRAGAGASTGSLGSAAAPGSEPTDPSVDNDVPLGMEKLSGTIAQRSGSARRNGFEDEDDDAPTAEQTAAAKSVARERQESPNEGPLESIGRAIGEGLTGAEQGVRPVSTPTKPANR